MRHMNQKTGNQFTSCGWMRLMFVRKGVKSIRHEEKILI